MVDQVVANIRKQIEEDQFIVGQKLPSETELMRANGVGRSTVREALRLLQAQGYVELRPNAGAFLFSKHPDDKRAIDWIAQHSYEMVEVMLLRRAVEGLAARISAERAADNDIYAMIGIQTLMEQAAQENDCMKLALYDEAFHAAIAKSTGNPLILTINNQIAASCANFRGKTFIAHKGFPACSAHRNILDAIRAHNADEAEACMQKHMDDNIALARSYRD